ncbi:MAG: methyltransferase domain-containing protein [Acidobacteria bacterium]|nr:methyltransferase domain-containing protein [Acidobacteriota bacterium]
MKRRLTVVTALLLYAALAQGGPGPDPLRLEAPEDLGPVIGEVVELFSRESGLRVETVLRAESAPGPSRAPGGLVLASGGDAVRALLYRDLVLAVPAGNPKLVFALGDLARPGTRIAIAGSGAGELGAATRELLAKEDPDGRLRGNIVMRLDGTVALADALVRGDADAAIVWDTAKTLRPGKIGEIRLRAPRRPLAVAFPGDDGGSASARKLAAFLEGERARALFASHALSLEPVKEPTDSDLDFYRNSPRHKFHYIYQLLARQIVDDYGITRGTALDVGCGGAQTLIHLAQLTDLQCTGLDIDPARLAVASENAIAAGVGDRFRFVAADAHALPLPDAYADLVISRGSIPFWRDRARVLREIDRVLKPGGVAFVGIGGSRYLTHEYFLGIQAPWVLADRREWLDIPDVENLGETMAATGIPSARYRILREGGYWVEIRK